MNLTRHFHPLLNIRLFILRRRKERESRSTLEQPIIIIILIITIINWIRLEEVFCSSVVSSCRVVFVHGRKGIVMEVHRSSIHLPLKVSRLIVLGFINPISHSFGFPSHSTSLKKGLNRLSTWKSLGEIIAGVASELADGVVEAASQGVAEAGLELLDVFLIGGWDLGDLVCFWFC